MDEMAEYQQVLESLEKGGVSFALGGAYALSVYTGLRRTKDIDLFLVPGARERAISMVRELGFSDMHAESPYDRGWIYRARRGEMIVDIIWSFANYRTRVEQSWIDAAIRLPVYGSLMAKVLALEELLWSKIYVMQRERCDWPDLLSLLYFQVDKFDWTRLFKQLGEDVPLLMGLLTVFAWMLPERARSLPPWIIEQAGLRKILDNPGTETNRTKLLDGRPWLIPLGERNS